MADTVIEGVHVVPGNGEQSIDCATVTIGSDGRVARIEAGGRPSGLVLVPAAVDIHLDNLRERRRPRATVELDHARVIAALDAECAAAGIGVVCVAARCEQSPGKGILLEHALGLADTVEDLAPHLACDWRLHVRVEVTDDGAIDTLVRILGASSRVALVSVMEHSADRTRFASVEEHRQFYAKDWGVPLEQVDEMLAVKRNGSAVADDRRREAAAITLAAGLRLGSHDDRSPDDVEAAFDLGATIAEFPLTIAAARRARELGMDTVLGAPNAVRGRSTSPGNLLVDDAVDAGVCDILCSDYLPTSLQDAPASLAARGVRSLESAVDLVAAHPARAIGLDPPRITVGEPLSGWLRASVGGSHLGVALWRDGQLVFRRSASVPALTEV